MHIGKGSQWWRADAGSCHTELSENFCYRVRVPPGEQMRNVGTPMNILLRLLLLNERCQILGPCLLSPCFAVLLSLEGVGRGAPVSN